MITRLAAKAKAGLVRVRQSSLVLLACGSQPGLPRLAAKGVWLDPGSPLGYKPSLLSAALGRVSQEIRRRQGPGALGPAYLSANSYGEIRTVKRKIAAGVVVTMLGAGLYLSAHRAAQGTPTAGVTAHPMKIVVLNLPLVIKKYKKYELYESQLKEFVKSAQEKEDRVRKELMALQEQAQKPDAKPDVMEEQLKIKKRQLEDLTMSLKKDFTKKQEEQMVQLYQEIEDMVKRLALSNGWSLVLQYGDVIDKKDEYNPRIIQHKVLGGVCMPMYKADGIDVSEVVADWLNKVYHDKIASNR